MLSRTAPSLKGARTGVLLRGSGLQRRSRSHLAPPYLLDDYIPRFQMLSPVQEAKKRSAAYAHLSDCNICPRKCGVNRFKARGTCLIGSDVTVNTIAPHFGEEPCIQGRHGSGSVFFSGCNLRCVFCQNHDIAHQKNGFDLTPEELAQWMVKLQTVGNVHNINFVTPEHVAPQVALAILHAKQLGLRVPIIYNTSSFDSLETIDLMDGLVDIYLADFKTWNPTTSKRLLKAENYAETAMESIKAMQEQVGDLCFTSDGIAKKGLLLRHLVMPSHEEEGKHIVRWLAENISKDLYIHIMEQYHPRAHVGKTRRSTSGRARDVAAGTFEPGDVPVGEDTEKDLRRYQDINRAVSMEEVDSVRKVAEAAGLWRFCDAEDRHGGFV